MSWSKGGEYYKYIVAIDEIVKKLPVLYEIVSSEFVYTSKIYGGFTRFFLSHCFRHNEPPGIEDVLGYLENSDIDIKIKSSQLFEYFQIVRDRVQSCAGTIVYLGNDYSKSFDHVESFDSKTSVYYGMYGIYIPMIYNEKKYTIRYEIFMSTQQCGGYEEDFSVNTFSVGYCADNSECTKYTDRYPKKTKIFMNHANDVDQLKSMKFSLCRSLLRHSDENVHLMVKKMYRLIKMYKQNYSLVDDDIKEAKTRLEICEKSIAEQPVLIHTSLNFPEEENTTSTVIAYSRGTSLLLDLPTFLREMKEIYNQLGFPCPLIMNNT
jgi:hypothetical protein